MSYLDYIMETKKTESTPTFSEWSKAYKESRAKEKSVLDATLAGVASQITAQHAEDLQKDIAKAQEKAASDVRSAYIAQGKANDEKHIAALRELTSSVNAKIEADQRAYNARYGNLFSSEP